MRALTCARSLFCLAASLAYGCVQPGQGEPGENDQDPHQPGEVLGFFAVNGKLGDDTCGADSLSAPAQWDFEVKLSREGSTLYWLNGREAIVGDIDSSGRFGFETHLDLLLAPKHGAAKGCTVVRSDSASGTLKSSASLSGELTYAYAATSDSDCSELITGSGNGGNANGVPLALPCSLSYALKGDRVSE
jgi:hypothetical protein